MKIMTFNTQHCQNFITKEIDFDIIADAIVRCDADVIGLNEMRGKGEDPEYEDQTAILSGLTGIENYYFAKAIDVRGNNPYGNAILSKYKIEKAEIIPIPDPEVKIGKRYETRCILKAKLENGYTILISHFGLNDDERVNAVKTVLDNLENEKCILMGDFNMRPDNEILKPIKEKLTDTADCFKGNLLSFPSDEPYCKIDYIFTTPDILVTKADIPAVIASDHRPITVNID